MSLNTLTNYNQLGKFGARYSKPEYKPEKELHQQQVENNAASVKNNSHFDDKKKLNAKNLNLAAAYNLSAKLSEKINSLTKLELQSIYNSHTVKLINPKYV